MIPCESNKIYEWNALDDLDDDISDRVNDDLLSSDHMNHQEKNDKESNYARHYYEYDDPDMYLGVDSFPSFASTVDSSPASSENSSRNYESRNNSRNDSRYNNNNNNSSNYSRSKDYGSSKEYSLDEDGLILALDDRTNRYNNNKVVATRKDAARKDAELTTRATIVETNHENALAVRVKKSVKYGNNNSNSIVRSHSVFLDAVENESNHQLAVADSNSRIHRSRSNSVIQATKDQALIKRATAIEANHEDALVVRVKKSVKYGTSNNSSMPASPSSFSDKQSNLDKSNNEIQDMLRETKIALSSIEETINRSDRVLASSKYDGEEPPPHIATIHSNGLISYEATQPATKHQAMVEYSAPTVATIRGDGTIRYDVGKPKEETAIVEFNNNRDCQSRGMVEYKEPTVATIKSDGTISYSNAEESNRGMVEYKEPTVATIKSDGTISYSTKDSKKDLVEYKEPTVATIKSDGTIDYSESTIKKPIVATHNSDGSITYRLGSSRSASDAIVSAIAPQKSFPQQQQPQVATIHGDGFITYSSTTVNTGKEIENIYRDLGGFTPVKDRQGCPPVEDSMPLLGPITPGSARSTASGKSVSFENIVTDLEDNDCINNDVNDDEEDMDDDICDKLDDSRYTRSLHSMPVLEEVTEEESPLHAASQVVVSPIALSSNPNSIATPRQHQEAEKPIWLELKKSPSATTTMTPGRTNDDREDDESRTPRWLRLGVSMLSSQKKAKRGGSRYQHMESPQIDSSHRNSNVASSPDTKDNNKSYRDNAMLRVETCSTGSQSDPAYYMNDLETGNKRCGKSSRKSGGKRCCSKRGCIWILLIVVVFLAFAIGIGFYYLVTKGIIGVPEENNSLDQDQDRTEQWTGSGWTIRNEDDNDTDSNSNSVGSVGPEASNDFQDFADPNSNSVESVGPEASNDFQDFVDANNQKDDAYSSSLAPSDAPVENVEVDYTSSPTLSFYKPGSPTISGRNPSTSAKIPTAPVTSPWRDPSMSPSIAPVNPPTNPPSTAISSSTPTDMPVLGLSLTGTPTTASPTITPSPTTSGKFTPVVRDTAAMNDLIRMARRQIELLIFDDDDLIGKFLRLVFHDCVGGCDGCVDMTNPENTGLDKPIDVLQPVVDRFEPEGLSRTDIWMMSALVATELALPFESSDMTFPLQWIGRQTCETRFADSTDPVTRHCGVDFNRNPTRCHSIRGPHVDQPHGTFGTTSILDFFKKEFDFNPQQVTAIMGAHSVGKMARENSGNMGTWDLSSTTLDAGYWQELAGNDIPDFFLETIDNSDLPNIPTRHQWRGIIKGLDARTVAMLNVDVALVHNIPDMDDQGNIGCAGPVTPLRDCPRETPFLPFAREYNNDNKKFLRDFRDVLSILINHGHTKPSECFEGRICSFGNHPGTIEIALEQLSHSPTSSPTRPPTAPPSRNPPKLFPEPPPGQPKISTDKICYDSVGDTMVVDWFSVSGFTTDLTFEVYASDDVALVTVEGRTRLDPRATKPMPLVSKPSCELSNCNVWLERGGLQIPTWSLQGNGSDYVVLMFGKTNPGENDLQLLAGNAFRLEGCND